MSTAQKEIIANILRPVNTALISIVAFLLVNFYNDWKESQKVLQGLVIENAIQKKNIQALQAQLDVNDLRDAQLKKNYWQILGVLNRNNINLNYDEDN